MYLIDFFTLKNCSPGKDLLNANDKFKNMSFIFDSINKNFCENETISEVSSRVFYIKLIFLFLFNLRNALN
jgi:hypothetical protein